MSPLRSPNRLMLFRETVAVYCENHMEHIVKALKCISMNHSSFNFHFL
jgi:3-hydroxymyristoyl/3-hydroxydecanoyl-(acyl carrier protein) dehydratase